MLFRSQKSFRDESVIELVPKIDDIIAYVQGRISTHQVFTRAQQDPSLSSLYGQAVSRIVDSAAGMYEKLPSLYEIRF